MKAWLKYRIPISIVGGMYVCFCQQQFNILLFLSGFLIIWLAYFVQSLYFIKSLQNYKNLILIGSAFCVELLVTIYLKFSLLHYLILLGVGVLFISYLLHLRNYYWLKSLIISASWLITLYIIPNIYQSFNTGFMIEQFILLNTLCLFFDYKHSIEDQLNGLQAKKIKVFMVIGILLVSVLAILFKFNLSLILIIPLLLLIQLKYIDLIKASWMYYTIDFLLLLQFING